MKKSYFSAKQKSKKSNFTEKKGWSFYEIGTIFFFITDSYFLEKDETNHMRLRKNGVENRDDIGGVGEVMEAK